MTSPVRNSDFGDGMIYAREQMVQPRTLDTPEAVCAFNSHDCSKLAVGHGGLDAHHRWPKSLNGPEHPDDLLALCPLHHSRQHSLIRYLVETHVVDWSVLIHFTPAEVSMAKYAVEQWKAAGSPHIAGWSRPAAR